MKTKYMIYAVPMLAIFLFPGCKTLGEFLKTPQPPQTAAGEIAYMVRSNSYRLPGKSIAVVDFTDINGNPFPYGNLFTERVVTEISAHNYGSIRIVERSFINKIIKEQKFANSGLTDINTAVKLGGILNVDGIVTGTIAQMSSYYEINARLINVRNAEIIKAATVKDFIDPAIAPANTVSEQTGAFVAVPTAVPAPKVSNHPPIAKIHVYIGDIQPGQSGPTPVAKTINIGGRMMLSAVCVDGESNAFLVENTKWTAENPGVLSINPSQGAKVIITGLRAGESEIIVEADGVRKVVDSIYVQ